MTINGKKTTINYQTINDIITSLQIIAANTVFTINSEIVDPSDYDQSLSEDDIIEIINFTSGG